LKLGLGRAFVATRLRQRCTRRAARLACRIALIPDEKVPNAATFRVAREDHTMGNLLRM